MVAHNVTIPATRGRILRTINGGYSWYIAPEKSQTLPAQDVINALAVCEDDPNFVVAGGLADSAADGFIMIGQA